MNCKHCENEHYFELTFVSQNQKELNKLANLVTGTTTEWNKYPNDISYEGITERCEHGDVQDCEFCEFTFIN